MSVESLSIALPHMRVELGGKKRNLERVRQAAQIAKNMGAHVIVLPSMFNVGPVNSPHFRVRVGKRSLMESIPGYTSEYLGSIARDIGITILAGPIYERVGSKTYRTVFLVEPLRGVTTKLRKLVSKKGAAPLNEAIIDYGLRLGLLVENDILLPELSLYLYLLEPHAIIAFPELTPEGTKQRLALFARSLECETMILAVGGIVSRGKEDLFELPTFVISENGEVVEEVRGMAERVIVVKVSAVTKKRAIDGKRLELLKKVRKLIREMK